MTDPTESKKPASSKEKGPKTLEERCAELPPLGDPAERDRLQREIRELCHDLEVRRRKANVFQTETMSFHVGLLGIVLLMLWMVAFGTTTTYTLIKIWPADSTPPGRKDAAKPEGETPTGAAGGAAAPGTARVPGAPAAPGAAAPPGTAPAPAQPPGAPATPQLAQQADTTQCRAGDPCADTVVVFKAGRILPGLTFDFRSPREGRRLLFIALFAGGVGAFLSSLLSLATYIGNRELTRSWAVWYLARPPAGMLLALLVYFILRGGLLTPAASVDVLSPYGVAAFSGLIGMFVRQAIDKMRDIAEAMFTSKVNEERSEPVHTDATTAAAGGGTGGGSGRPKGPAAPPKPPTRPGGAANSTTLTASATTAPPVQGPGA